MKHLCQINTLDTSMIVVLNKENFLLEEKEKKRPSSGAPKRKPSKPDKLLLLTSTKTERTSTGIIEQVPFCNQ